MRDTNPPDAGLDLYAIAPTQFSADAASVDGGAMAGAAERLAAAGITDFLLAGSYGEFQSLSDAERLSMLRAVRGARAVRSIMCCAAGASTVATADLAARMFDEGADTVMVSPPLAAEVREDDIRRHFAYLANRLPGGLVVYNNPVFGIDLTAAQLGEIASLGQVVAVKQGTRSLGSFAESLDTVRKGSHGHVRVLAASDLTAALTLLAGAAGLTSTNSWVFPGIFTTLRAAASRGDCEVVQRAARSLEPYFSAVRTLGQPRTVKAAMQLRGYPGSDSIRLPYAALTDAERSTLRQAIEECDASAERLSIIDTEEVVACR